jgi:hypothetical protein
MIVFLLPISLCNDDSKGGLWWELEGFDYVVNFKYRLDESIGAHVFL